MAGWQQYTDQRAVSQNREISAGQTRLNRKLVLLENTNYLDIIPGYERRDT